MNADAASEEDTLKQNGGTAVVATKYKDPYTRLCSARWGTAICIYFAFGLLYMHRVNLSLAVVCMVDTTKSEHEAVHLNETTPINGSVHLIKDSSKGIINIVGLNTTNDINTNSSYVKMKNNSTMNDVLEQTTPPSRLDEEAVCGLDSGKSDVEWTAEIHWTKAEISILLSSYFYGSFFTQIPAGTLADKYGGKHIVTGTIALSGVCALVTPIFARTSLILMFVVRIVLGLAGGAVIPASISMINKWATPRERPVMIALSGAGLLSGTIFTYLTSGLLCAYGFDNGWPSIFYLHGCLSFLFILVWCFTTFNSPSVHPRVSQEEKDYIQKCKGNPVITKAQKIPWKQMLLSKPLWATIVSHFCFNWSFFTVLINVPLFLKEVLKFEIKSNGLYSSLPYVFQIISCICSSALSEVIIKKHIRFHLAIRRTFNTVSLFGIAACLILAGYVTCESRHIAVVLLCMSSVFGGVAYGGFFANHSEYAGQFAGTAFGMTNAAGVISSILPAMLAGLLTPNGLQEEWQVVFYLAAGVDIFGAIFFAIFSDVYIQPWARTETSITIEVNDEQPAQEMLPLNEHKEPAT